MSSRRWFLGGLGSLAAATALGGRALARARTPPAAPRLRTARTPTRVRTNDGVELYTKDWGSGRPVVFVHGWPFSADMWDHHAAVLAEAGFRVITYDKRGFGRSSQPWSGYDFDTLADDLAAILEATDVRDATLVGYSMGGGEIVRYLSRHGAKRIASIALIASIVPGLPASAANPKGIPGSVFDGIKTELRKDKATFLAGVIKDVIYDPAVRSTHPVTPEVLAWSQHMAMQAGLRPLLACVDAFGRTDFRAELAAVTVPALIVHGTADKPVPFEASARAAAQGIARAKLVEYAGASHGIPVTERDRVTSDLLGFVGG